MDTILQDLKRNLERSDRNVELLQDQFETFQDRMIRRIDEGLRENRAITLRLFFIAMSWVLMVLISLIYGFSRVAEILW